MILITVIMFLAAILGGIPTVAKSPECLIISRALVGLHCGKILYSIYHNGLYFSGISEGYFSLWNFLCVDAVISVKTRYITVLRNNFY